MITIKTYDELELFADRWIAGTIDLLIIESRAGLGKSHLIKEKLKGKNYFLVNSHITPLQNYKELYRNRDINLIVFDDIFQLLVNKLNISILKQVCETSPVKKLCWFSTTNLLDETPMEFSTCSKVLIVCNNFEGRDPHVRAIKDRGFHIKFKPTRMELLNKMQEVALNYPYLEQHEKEKVLNILESNSKNIKHLSLRSLVKGFQLFAYFKLKGTGWRKDFLRELGLNEKLVALNQLICRFKTDMERLKHWKWSKQTYYTYKHLVK